MARVDSWFLDFADRHAERVPRADWPALDSEFWLAWRKAFVRHGVTEAVAETASERVAECPPQYLDRQLDAMLEKAREAFRADESGATPAARPAADRESRDCPHCGGSGWLVATAAVRTLSDKTHEARTSFACVCPLGRFYLNLNPPIDGRPAVPDAARFPNLLERREFAFAGGEPWG